MKSEHVAPNLVHGDVISQLTLAEKASLMSGANFWNTKPVLRLGIPSIMLTDGPHGLRKQAGAADHLGLNASVPATCFPTAATLANSWDRELLFQVGEALGKESAAEDVSVLLGPGLNIKRNPLSGRNFEYFSEDPMLAGELSATFIQGVQSRGVAACPKHFAVNSQETHRMSVDEIVDERAMHELYLEAFRLAVTKGEPATLMSSYNKVNGTYANENEELLHNILRDRWGFPGLVVTDWGGNNDRVAAIKAGNALEMPSTNGMTDAEIVAAVKACTLDEAILDQRVSEVLTLVAATAPGKTDAPAVDFAAQHALAVEVARQSIVLLKNRDRVLPLGTKSGRVAVIGDFAKTPRYQGAGSSLVNPTEVVSFLDAAAGNDLNIIGYEPGFRRLGQRSTKLHRAALDLASRADTVLLFLGLDEAAEAEGSDRTHMRLANNQLELVRDLLRRNTNIVLVLCGGSPVELPFAGAMSAIVHGYLPGQGGGQAIVDVLTGAHNPSGKLAETYPLHYRDVPSAGQFTRHEATAEHRDSIYLGYRYYDKVAAPVRYEFGYGLSYTTFAYGDLAVSTGGAEEICSATVTVTNTGDRAGAEVVQIYTQAHDGTGFRAVRELAGFAKVNLAPGESCAVTVPLREHAFSLFDPEAQDWRVQPGRYTVWAGASSRDLRARASIVVEGDTISSFDDEGLPRYVSGQVQAVGTEEFERLLGRRVPPADWPTDQPLTTSSIIAQGRGRGGAAGLLYATITGAAKVLMKLGRPLTANNALFLLDLPFRSVARMSGGLVNMEMLDGIMIMMNGQAIAGLRHVWRERRRHLVAQRRAQRRG